MALGLLTLIARRATAQDPVMGFRPVATAAAPAGLVAADDSVLHIGATVRVQVPAFGKDTLPGVVVHVATPPAGCLAIRLERHDTAGRPYIVVLTQVASMEVDWRTNLGVHSEGISMPQASDWHPVAPADLARANAACRRGRG